MIRDYLITFAVSAALFLWALLCLADTVEGHEAPRKPVIHHPHPTPGPIIRPWPWTR